MRVWNHRKWTLSTEDIQIIKMDRVMVKPLSNDLPRVQTQALATDVAVPLTEYDVYSCKSWALLGLLKIPDPPRYLRIYPRLIVDNTMGFKFPKSSRFLLPGNWVDSGTQLCISSS